MSSATGTSTVRPVARRLIALGLGLLLLSVFIYIFPLIDDIISVIIISMVISYALRPLMTSLEQKGINRVLTILILFVAFAGLLSLGFSVLVPRLIEQLADIGAVLNQIDIRQIRSDSIEWLGQYLPDVAHVLDTETSGAAMLADRLRGLTTDVLEQSANVLAEVVNVLSLISIIPILIFFMLKDGRQFTQSFIRQVPNRFFEMTLSLIHNINRTIGDYIVSVFLSSLFIAGTTWAGLSLIGISYPLALAVIAGLFNVIPFFGPLLTMIVVTVVILLTEASFFWPLLSALILLNILQQVESVVVKPMLLSHSMSIHPAVVILAVLIGGRIAGPIGMFIAVPVYSIIKMFIYDLYEHLKNYRII